MDQHFYRLAQGLRLSSLGIGTYLGRADDETDRAYEGALRTAIEGGINVLDTSRNYRGERSELAIGRVLQDFDREKLVLCTKAGYYLDRNAHSLEPEFLEENLRLSLVNLGVAEVDIFYLHNPETQLRERGEEAFYDIARAAFERCEALVAQGLTRYYGAATWDGFRLKEQPLSLYRLSQIAHEIAGPRHRFRFIQLPFNLAMLEGFNLRNQAGSASTLQAAGELGITVIGSATVLQGKLTHSLPEPVTAKLPGLETDAQRSIQFSRSTPGIAVSLVGMSSAGHVRSNLAIKNTPPLTDQEYYAIYAR